MWRNGRRLDQLYISPCHPLCPDIYDLGGSEDHTPNVLQAKAVNPQVTGQQSKCRHISSPDTERSPKPSLCIPNAQRCCKQGWCNLMLSKLYVGSLTVLQEALWARFWLQQVKCAPCLSQHHSILETTLGQMAPAVLPSVTFPIRSTSPDRWLVRCLRQVTFLFFPSGQAMDWLAVVHSHLPILSDPVQAPVLLPHDLHPPKPLWHEDTRGGPGHQAAAMHPGSYSSNFGGQRAGPLSQSAHRMLSHTVAAARYSSRTDLQQVHRSPCFQATAA